MTVSKSSRARHFSLLLLAVGLIGCTSLTKLGIALSGNDPVTPIMEVKTQNQGSTIYLSGKVQTQAPFVEGGAYQLQDNTGTIWVRTNTTLPQLGSDVVIKAQVDYQSIPVGTQELGEFYVLELEQVKQDSESIPKPEVKPTNQQIEDLLLPHKQQQK